MIGKAAALAALVGILGGGCAAGVAVRIGGQTQAFELAWEWSLIDPRIGEKHATTRSRCGEPLASVSVYKDAASPAALEAACEIIPATAEACAKGLAIYGGACAIGNAAGAVAGALSGGEEELVDSGLEALRGAAGLASGEGD